MKVKYTKYQIALDIVAFMLLAGMYIYLLVSWGELPDQIPGHYNALGEIDRWGRKTELIFLPGISTFLFLLLTGVSFFPSAWNTPVKVTDENRDRMYSSVRYLLGFMKIEIMAMFLYLLQNSMNAEPLPAVFLPVVMVAVFGTIIWFSVRMVKSSQSK
jgi:uncharacterized membrane protein